METHESHGEWLGREVDELASMLGLLRRKQNSLIAHLKDAIEITQNGFTEWDDSGRYGGNQ